jgi:ABC-type uncharacterized transport system substrate-binding protein
MKKIANTRKSHYISGLLIVFLSMFFQGCIQQKTEKPKVIYINSYHKGHPSSDQIMDAVWKAFPADSFHLVTYIMDTKRNSSQEYVEKKSAQLYDSIRIIRPDVVIVSDDNAVKYLIQPYFSEIDPPVVFCGINWSDTEYNLKNIKVTGMLEILPLAEVLIAMKTVYPAMKKLLVLNENTTTSRKEKLILDSLYNRVGLSVEHELVDDFDSWKTHFKEGNKIFDILYISTNGAIKGWNNVEAEDFVSKNISVPVVTCEDFMMPYAVLGITKVAEEQGIWAAATAKRILKGKNPFDIPVTRNLKSKIWLNTRLAERINFQPDKALIENAEIAK